MGGALLKICRGVPSAERLLDIWHFECPATSNLVRNVLTERGGCVLSGVVRRHKLWKDGKSRVEISILK